MRSASVDVSAICHRLSRCIRRGGWRSSFPWIRSGVRYGGRREGFVWFCMEHATRKSPRVILPFLRLLRIVIKGVWAVWACSWKFAWRMALKNIFQNWLPAASFTLDLKTWAVTMEIGLPRVPSRWASRFFGKIAESWALKGESQANKRAIASHKRKHDEISRLDGMGHGVIVLQQKFSNKKVTSDFKASCKGNLVMSI